MPLKNVYGATAALPPEPEEDPSFIDRLKGFIPAGVRGATGLLSGAVSMTPGLGTLIGGGIAGAGELGAELLEGSEPSLKRIGAEAALGAVPGGKLIKSGKFLGSALRGGAFAGLGSVMRQKAMAPEEPLDLGNVALQTATGGVVSGALGKVLGLGRVPPVNTPPPYVVETTAHPGGYVLSGLKKGPKTVQNIPPAPIPASGQAIPLPPSSGLPPRAPIPYGGAPVVEDAATAAKARVATTKELMRDQRQLEKLQVFLAGKARAAEKLAEHEANAARIAQAREGLEQGAPRVSESYSAPIPGGGRESLTIPYRQAAEDVEDVLPSGAGTPPAAPRSPDLGPGRPPAPQNPFVAQAVAASEPGAGKPPATPFNPVLTPADIAATNAARDAEIAAQGVTQEQLIAAKAARDAELAAAGAAQARANDDVVVMAARGQFSIVPPAEPTSALAAFFKSPVEAVGAAYRGTKGVGQNPLARRQLGTNLQQEAGRAGLPTRGPGNLAGFLRDEVSPDITRKLAAIAPGAEAAVPRATAVPSAAPIGAAEATPDWVTKQLGIVDRLKKLSEEQGVASPQFANLMTHLGLAGAGAVVGGATDPLDNPWLSAAAGAGLGALTPNAIQALQQIGIPKDQLQSGGLTIDKVRELVPQVMRFNYLASAKGLPANAFVGPYGSAVMGALEHGLAGDPRGWAALKELRNPIKFAKEAKDAWDEASGLIGRAEGHALSEAPTITERVLAVPGTTMTAGDVAARRALQRAGFSEDDARRITLTSEPELRPAKRMAGFTKGSPELQTLMPFSRTPANILEQGSMRIPGLGALVQRQREIPDALRQQLVQQGMGAAVGTGAGVLGANLDPDTARNVRRYVTNAAGQYSLPAAIGFAAGQAVHRGKSPISGGVNELAYSLPLPTVEPMVELGRFLSDPGAATLPRWAYPTVFREQGRLEIPGVGPSVADLTEEQKANLRIRR